MIDDKYIKGDLIHEMTKVHTKAIRNAIWFDIDESAIASVSFDQTCALTNISTAEKMQRNKSVEPSFFFLKVFSMAQTLNKLFRQLIANNLLINNFKNLKIKSVKSC